MRERNERRPRAGGAGARVEAHVVEMRCARLPQQRAADAQLAGEGGTRAGRDGVLPQAGRDGAVARAECDALGAGSVVVHHDRVRDPGGAARARELRKHLHAGEVDPLDAAQVDLTQQPAVVPPAADDALRPRPAERRQVRLGVGVADAQHESVDCRAVQIGRGQHDLEGQERAGVHAEPVSVQPDRDAVVDRLEPDDPRVRRRARGKHEVPAIPADGGRVAGGGLLARVPRVGHADRGPAAGRTRVLEAPARADPVVEAKQPSPAEQVATARAGGVEAAGRRRLARGSPRRGGAACCCGPAIRGRQQHEQREQPEGARCEPSCRRAGRRARSRRGQQSAVSGIGTLTARSLITSPERTLPVRWTRTHCTTGSLLLVAFQAMRVSPTVLVSE
jgi:hypothetical protein